MSSYNAGQIFGIALIVVIVCAATADFLRKRKGKADE